MEYIYNILRTFRYYVGSLKKNYYSLHVIAISNEEKDTNQNVQVQLHIFSQVRSLNFTSFKKLLQCEEEKI